MMEEKEISQNVAEEAAQNKQETQAQQVSEEKLSDDEMYAQIQTEKLLKKKKKRQIITMLSLCFCFALAVSLIVLCVVPVSLKPSCVSNDFSTVKLYPGTSTTGKSFEKGTEQYDKFMTVFNKAFEQTYISAIFEGNLNNYKIDETRKTISTNTVITDLTANGKYIMHLRYDKKKVITRQNGGKYKSVLSNNTTWKDGQLYFTDVYLEIDKSENGGFKPTVVHIAAEDPSGSVQSSSTFCWVDITIKANTNAIYKEWNNLFEL